MVEEERGAMLATMEQRRETVDKEDPARSFNSKHLHKQCFLNKPSPNLGVSNLTT